MAIVDIHLILIMFSSLHSLILFPLNIMLQIPLSKSILFWPKFYYSLFKYREGRRYFWSILTKPLGAYYRRLDRQPNKITCLNVNYYCHSFYQGSRYYAQLHQQSDKDIEDTVSATTTNVFYDDP